VTTTPGTDRQAHRDALRDLITRVGRGRAGADIATLLTSHLNAEFADADQARAQRDTAAASLTDLRNDLYAERAAHEEHRRSLAALHGLHPDADWLNVTAAVTSTLGSRDRDHRFLTEARRLRDEACGTLDAQQLVMAKALGLGTGATWDVMRERAETAVAAATERADLLEEARDALEAAGQNGPHGDDWPAIAPGIRHLADEVKRLGLMVDEYGQGARQLSEKLRAARATLTAVRAQATDWAQLAAPGDIGTTPDDTTLAGAGHIIIEILGDPQPATEAPSLAAVRQPAYDAVSAYIRALPREGAEALPASTVQRNAMIWRGVNAALDALPATVAREQPAEPECTDARGCDKVAPCNPGCAVTRQALADAMAKTPEQPTVTVTPQQVADAIRHILREDHATVRNLLR
jgi:hypothetical protein